MTEVRLDFRLPEDAPPVLPVLPLRRGVLLPGAVLPLSVGRAASLAAVEAAGDLVIVAAQVDDAEVPSPAQLLPIATLARIVDRPKAAGTNRMVVVQGLGRVRLDHLEVSQDGRLDAGWSRAWHPWPDDPRATALARELTAEIQRTAEAMGATSDLRPLLRTQRDPSFLADACAAMIEASAEWKKEILVTLDPVARAESVLRQLTATREVLSAQRSIRDRIETEARDQHKEALLRRQLDAIRKELGEGGEAEADLDALKRRLGEKDLPAGVRSAVDRELRRLERLNPQSPERGVAVDWLEWIADLPFSSGPAAGSAEAEPDFDLDAVGRALDASHTGLEEVKRQVLEHLAVHKLAGSGRADVLLLVGPPGVGKTSIGNAIAEATGRELVRVALGGVTDEAELRGHRRTYIGARPGRLIEGLRRAKSDNPVILFDEVDKLGRGWRGDPAAALLEILDPEQNHAFTDHYLEVPFDLSRALFIATANDLDPISEPLRDRMEVLHIAGYTREEKLGIARAHLLEKLARNAGVDVADVAISDEVIRAVIDGWTREAGVRQLQRVLGRLYRAAAMRKATGRLTEPLAVTEDNLREFLKKRPQEARPHEGVDQPGVATGLAWTPAGGDVLYVETAVLPGDGKLVLTGQLGEVMKESARAALTYVMSHHEALGVPADALRGQDVHIHVPAGAVPKDGPSAGVTMFTALASLLTGRQVRSDTAMTGEATLRGRVLAVGGIKAKVLAAHRAGLRRVILPRACAPDLDEVPAEVLDHLEVVLVDTMGEVLAAALDATSAERGVA